jgi:hypothetical protein
LDVGLTDPFRERYFCRVLHTQEIWIYGGGYT